jgi:hypothetical protein
MQRFDCGEANLAPIGKNERSAVDHSRNLGRT